MAAKFTFDKHGGSGGYGGSGGSGRVEQYPLISGGGGGKVSMNYSTATAFPPQNNWSAQFVGTPVTPESVLAMVEAGLGIVAKPLKKCPYCGQWGAVYCACTKCGAPIDP